MWSNIYQLSLTQREIYYDQLLHPETPIYNIGAKIEVNGDLDVEIFRKAVQLLVKQHDALRSVITFVNEMPHINVLSNAEADVFYRDFSKCKDPVSSAEKFIQEEFVKLFDLTGKTLLNSYYLLKIGPSRSVFVAKYHHLIVDGWSTALLFNRLSDNYT
ncbi:MAG TPA: condensation domain-containing protein, partial [Hymenobacter sp.]